MLYSWHSQWRTYLEKSKWRRNVKCWRYQTLIRLLTNSLQLHVDSFKNININRKKIIKILLTLLKKRILDIRKKSEGVKYSVQTEELNVLEPIYLLSITLFKCLMLSSKLWRSSDHVINLTNAKNCNFYFKSIHNKENWSVCDFEIKAFLRSYGWLFVRY